ncbi:alpha/beta hydrolase [Formosa undariae]|uniref:Alpha/beta hydrolase n=1 Tax=Formosa undariae TaxID=1325436 RepID=A0ABV5EZ78_9FLAO
MNLTEDYTSETISLKPDYEGEVIAVLTASNFNTGDRKSILYIHGYIDYFFHPHLGEFFNTNHFDFYALDLRKYGRALLPHQHPNYCKNIEEYFEELSLAILHLKSKSSGVYLLGHSTGGLTASCYMNSGKERHLVDGLILNSPFFDFNQTKLEKYISQCVAKMASKISSYAKVNGVLTPAYAKSIHKDYFGEWDFNLDWKPIKGFPTYFKWVLAIAAAQQSLVHSNIQVPVLVMHSSGSIKTSKFSKQALSNDIVLNIEDIKRIGKTLGNQVTLLEIDHAQHDIFLSPKVVRERALNKMMSWLLSN